MREWARRVARRLVRMRTLRRLLPLRRRRPSDLNLSDLRDLFEPPRFASPGVTDLFRGAPSPEAPIAYPDVYRFAAHLGQRLGCTSVIDIGCVDPRRVVGFQPRFEVFAAGPPDVMAGCRARLGFGTWVDWEPDRDLPDLPDALDRCVIVCAGVLDGMRDQARFLERLSAYGRRSAAMVLAADGEIDLESMLTAHGFDVSFAGLTVSDDSALRKNASIALVERSGSRSAIVPAPDDFRALAIIATYNEEDVIESTVERLVAQGLDVHVMDNWSTDTTFARATALANRGLARVERFPAEGPVREGDLSAILARKDEIARTSGADWVMHHDADEIRIPPWPGVTLKDAVHHADRCGFTAIDHLVVEFHPVDDAYVPGSDLQSRFRHFAFARRPERPHVKAWKNLGRPVNLHALGGHIIDFDGRRVFPYKFLLKHYPFRSQAHGEKKIFAERQPRYEQETRMLGWHRHYYQYGPGHRFVRDPDELEVFDQETFDRTYVVERLSGIGLVR